MLPENRKPQSLKQQVYDHLSSLYLANELNQGDPLNEVEISTRLQISRTPVREAFLQLEKEGIVEIIPRKGAFIRRISLHDIIELFQIREAIEGMAASLSAGRLSPELLAELEVQFTAARIESEISIFQSAAEEAGEKLHRLIIEISQNRRIKEILNNYRTLLDKEHRDAALIPKRIEESYVEHLQILQGLRTGPEAAESAMRLHIRNTRDALIRYQS